MEPDSVWYADMLDCAGAARDLESFATSGQVDKTAWKKIDVGSIGM